MDNTSAQNLWEDFLDKHTEFTFKKEPKYGYFSDNEKDANYLVELVTKDIKKASSHSLLGFQLREEQIPKLAISFWSQIGMAMQNALCVLLL